VKIPADMGGGISLSYASSRFYMVLSQQNSYYTWNGSSWVEHGQPDAANACIQPHIITLRPVVDTVTSVRFARPMCHVPTDLTPRELEVIRLLVDGLSNQEIADRLGLSRRTVQAHIANAMSRTERRSRTQLPVVALRHGLVPLGAPERTCDR
jgi:DNA-binding NarL/FixJ family response regulator